MKKIFLSFISVAMLTTFLTGCFCKKDDKGISDDTTKYTEKAYTNTESEIDEIDIREIAEECGYTVEEELMPGSYNMDYIVFFKTEDNTIMISNTDKYIYFYDKLIDVRDISVGMGYAYNVRYNDGEKPDRNQFGKWLFSEQQKQDITNVLTGFKDRGIDVFGDFSNNAENYFNEDYLSLVKAYNLNSRVQKMNDYLYRFTFFDNKGKMAYFYAEYTEADFLKDGYATKFCTWDNGKSDINWSSELYARDYIKTDKKLYSTVERLEDIKKFFS